MLLKCKPSTDNTRDSYSKSTATCNGMLAARGIFAKERVQEPNDLALGASLITPLSPNGGRDCDVKQSSASKDGNVARKLLITHRKLIIELTKLSRELASCSTLEQFNDFSDKFDALQSAYNDFQCDLKLVKDPSDLIQLNDRVPDLYKKCHMLQKQCKRHFFDEMYWYDCENYGAPFGKKLFVL